jgi:hypothetical protein
MYFINISNNYKINSCIEKKDAFSFRIYLLIACITKEIEVKYQIKIHLLILKNF